MKTDIFSADLWYQTIVILMLVFGVLYVYCIFGMMVRMVALGFIAMHENCLNRQVKNKVDSFSSFICICVSWHTYTYTQTRWFIAISFIYFDKIRENSLSLSLHHPTPILLWTRKKQTTNTSFRTFSMATIIKWNYLDRIQKACWMRECMYVWMFSDQILQTITNRNLFIDIYCRCRLMLFPNYMFGFSKNKEWKRKREKKRLLFLPQAQSSSRAHTHTHTLVKP